MDSERPRGDGADGMKLTVSPSTLQAALSVAQTAIKRSPTWLIAEHVLLEASEDRLTVSGTDLESRAWHTIAAEIEEPGRVTLPPKAITDFLDAVIPSEPVTLTVAANHKAELTSGRTRIRAAGLDPEQFPVCPSFDDPAFDHTMPAETLATLIRSTAFAAAKNDSRPVLAGVLFKVQDGALTMAAADGFRLAIREAHVEDAPDLDVVVHARLLGRLANALDKATSARLRVDATRSSLLIGTEAGCWTARLIDGQFPDFRRIIPQDVPIAVTIRRDDLLRASRLTRNMQETVTDRGVSTSTQIARLTVRQDEIALRSVGTEGDREAEIVIESVRERGDDLEIGFNGGYFRDAVEAIDAVDITLEMAGPARPTLIRAAGERNGHCHVIMPMHVARP